MDFFAYKNSYLPPEISSSYLTYYSIEAYANNGSGAFDLFSSYTQPIDLWFEDNGTIYPDLQHLRQISGNFQFNKGVGSNEYLPLFMTSGIFSRRVDKLASYSLSNNSIYHILPGAYGGGVASVIDFELVHHSNGYSDVAIFFDDFILWHYAQGSNPITPEIEIANISMKHYEFGAISSDPEFDFVIQTEDSLKIFIQEDIEFLEVFGIPSLMEQTGSIHLTDIDGDADIDVLVDSGIEYLLIKNTTGEDCLDIAACNFNPEAWIEDNSLCCYENCGCTDPIAENFSESAICDDDTCEYIEGCSNPLAFNYDPLVTLDIDNCVFQITGVVFFDENENGIQDNSEYGLPFQSVTTSGFESITNDNGEFFFFLTSETGIASIGQNLLFPFFTNSSNFFFDASSSGTSHISFGISNEVPDFAVCIDLYPSGIEFLCNDYSNHNICYRNMGNVPIDGIIELEYDELFQGHQEVTEIDSVDGNIVYMSFENLLPGEMFFYDISLLTPTVDHIGEYVTSTARAYGYYEGEEVAYGEQELNMEITCAYDPNDKQAFPLGYSDEHWLLPETEQEFLVRFQNTGNAPAQDIRIQDTIDVNYDLSTFRMVANSHSVMTTINEETRVIDFFFQDIQLPDSVNNEPDSHGLISYAIAPYAGLDVGTELNNTAFIYFDNNEAIVTNTTWTTIHECGEEAGFEASEIEICPEEVISFTSSYQHVEEFQWNIESVSAGNEPTHSEAFIEPGEYIIQLVAENPLCQESSMQMITVLENPSAEFTNLQSDICLGDSVTINASNEELQSYQWAINSVVSGEGNSLTPELNQPGEFLIELSTENENCSNSTAQSITVHAYPTAEITEDGAILTADYGETYLWFLNGTLIPSANFQTYEAVEDGSYSVVILGENNCTTQSEEVMIVSIKELDSPIVILYPNPMTEVAFIEFKDSSIRTVKLLDVNGKEVRVWNGIATQKLEIQKQDLAAGNYVIQVYEGNEISTVKLVVE